eukprot:CAMPEP_0116972974 /NCGR_PEP_ID=MMETSP0467-20121206/54197_1 /TAXON_ID=283647 /ORGANISM="Mesodinium pulex, Strain SPMC105" /LENGTH=55 /DNA_ID=CAMNT_0004664639 /DNA_START=37 /DNA_END=201 /DNA_ORIENTATION=+
MSKIEFKQFCEYVNSGLDDNDINDIFNDMDENKNGGLEEDEFMDVFKPIFRSVLR